MYRFTSALITGHLIKRYKRFLADVQLDSGEVITAHCPNTGAMTGCDTPGARVYLSKSNNAKRKYAYTWEYSSDELGNKIGINTANANRVVKQALLDKRVSELAHYSTIVPESKVGDSRIDFMLQEDGAPDVYLEVKSATLAKGETALFPDTLTTRGQKHCYELAKLSELAHPTFLLFLIQREGIQHFRIADECDPEYAKAIEYAQEKGVTLLAYLCNMSETGIEIAHSVEIS